MPSALARVPHLTIRRNQCYNAREHANHLRLTVLRKDNAPMTLYPLLLDPVPHTRVWGGRRLETEFGKMLPTTEPYGESWEVHDTAVVANGAHAGKTLGELLRVYGAALVGAGNDPAAGFPLLLKILDANDWLSVQVHPNDEQARALEGDPRGKTEAWYVLASEPGAKLVIGIQPGTSQAAMADAIRENRLEDLLVYGAVTPGDVLFVRANTVHALGPGLLIYEIQQSSDVTYRLYDWGRMGLDGKPRQLHIEKGVQVSNLAALPEITHVDETTPTATVVESAYFVTLLHRLAGGDTLMDTEMRRFHILTCVKGSAEVEVAGAVTALPFGRTLLIPADSGAYILRGAGEVLRSLQND